MLLEARRLRDSAGPNLFEPIESATMEGDEEVSLADYPDRGNMQQLERRDVSVSCPPQIRRGRAGNISALLLVVDQRFAAEPCAHRQDNGVRCCIMPRLLWLSLFPAPALSAFLFFVFQILLSSSVQARHNLPGPRRKAEEEPKRLSCAWCAQRWWFLHPGDLRIAKIMLKSAA